MQLQCVQYVIAGHILILITDHIEVTSPGSFKMWTIFNQWAHCDYFVSVNTMSSQCTCWVFDPLSPVSATQGGSAKQMQIMPIRSTRGRRSTCPHFNQLPPQSRSPLLHVVHTSWAHAQTMQVSMYGHHLPPP